jgi:hypothetical protein
MSWFFTQAHGSGFLSGGPARVLPNPSFERTPYGMLRMPSVVAHVER